MTASAIYNSELVDALSADFVRNNAAATAWGNIIGCHQMLPGLRGYWPLNIRDETLAVYDLSEQGRTLTNMNTVGSGVAGLLFYANFTAASSHYFMRADEAGLSITGAITVGGWFRFDRLGTQETLIAKWNATGNQRSYLLEKTAGDLMRFVTTPDGTAASQVEISSASAITATGVWHHIVGAYSPSTEVDVFLDGIWARNTTAVNAAIYDSTAEFNIARLQAGNYFDGQAAHAFVCGYICSNTVLKALWHHTRALFGR